MNRAALRLIAVFLLIIGLACPASAQTTKTAWEKQIGTDCSNGGASADFDTLAQCSATSGSGTFQKAPLFVGQVTSPPYATTACDAAKAGMLQYTGGVVQYCNGSAWSTMGSSSGTGGQSMFSGLPDVIICSYPGNYLPFYQHGTNSSVQTQYNTVDNSGRMIFFDSSGNYNSNSYASDFDCVTNARSLSYLVANGKAFNFVNGGANGAAAMADGTAGAPGLYFSADTNTGLYRPTTDNLAIATGGVERLRVTATGSVGIGTTNPWATLHVNGNIISVLPANPAGNTMCYTTGTNIFGYCSSDRRLKSKIEPIYQNMLDAVTRLRPVTFIWKKGKKTQYAGFIAQEVQEVIPLAARKNPDGFYDLDIAAITAYMAGAIRELKAENDALRAEIQAKDAAFAARLDALEARGK
jgi:hypothetical protein